MSDHHDEEVRKHLYHIDERLELVADRLDHLAESGLETSKGIDRIANALARIATALERPAPAQRGM
jgi:fatty acid-binding protein DegV